MKNLGRLLLVFLFTQSYIYALVVASIDSKNVQLGDTLTLSISLQGEDIKRPNIYTVCGENVIATGSSTSLKYINGDYEKEYILTYKFIPTKSCTVEPIDISINATIEKTLPIEIIVDKTLTSSDSEFSLEMLSDKKEVYVGEAFQLAVLFKQRKSVKIVDNKFTQPSFKGFWIKGEPQQSTEENATYNITKIIYALTPQREGILNISSANIKIAKRKNSRDYFGGIFPDVKWKTYFSNDLNITAKPLPNGINLVGDFTIEAFVNKTEVNPNEAVNLTIKVSGEGNLEDIKTFKPYVGSVSVFDEKIIIEKNSLSQKITFVGDNSFTIPAFTLKTFNTLTNEEKLVTTQPIQITIKNAKQKEELKIQREEVIEKPVTVSNADEFNKLWLIGVLLLGVLLGIFIMLLKPLVSFERKKKLDLKDTKMLLVKLMPYKENEDVKKIVDILENNLYSDDKKELDKKVLKEIISKYEIV